MNNDNLDLLLYDWLSAQDEQEAERRFTRYFRCAYPEICRYIRSFRADASTSEDIAQRSLIKLFTHLGTERKAADIRVREALSKFHPLGFGSLHRRLVERWRERLRGFRDAALTFRVSEGEPGTDRWQNERAEINGRLEPLLAQARVFLKEVHVRVGAALFAVSATATQQSAIGSASARDGGRERSGPAEGDVPTSVTCLLRCVEGQLAEGLEEKLRCPGVVDFVRAVVAVSDDLPALAIPSNGLLYTIAKRLFLDSLRQAASRRSMRLLEAPDGGEAAVLDGLDLESPLAAVVDQPCAPVDCDYATADANEGPDDHGAQYRAFLEFLRLPLTRAEARRARAASTIEARAERARVDALAAKYARLLAILRALHESPQPSEEEIGRRLGLTRNQVKYAIEKIREEFMRFFPHGAPGAQRRRKRVAVSVPAGSGRERPAPADSPSRLEARSLVDGNANAETVDAATIMDSHSGERP